MSQENVELFEAAIDAYNRRDIDAMLEGQDPEVEWHPVLQVLLGGEPTVYWGHEGFREFVADLDEAFAELQIETDEVRDLGDRVFASGRLRGRGKVSGAETETPIYWLVDFKAGMAMRILSYVDSKAALEAAGLSE